MRIPKHIGIIPDGNRRWAEQRGKGKEEGYDYGVFCGLSLLEDLKELGVEEVTFYGFTTDNCKRPKVQQIQFIQACVQAVEKMKEQPVTILVVGNRNSSVFPKELEPYDTPTKMNGGGMRVNFLVNYGWAWDLSKLEGGGKTPKDIQENLYSCNISRIDLVIRWGGMRRLSGFLPVQSVYADFYVTPTLWPDYEKQDLTQAIEWYQNQDVTLGG